MIKKNKDPDYLYVWFLGQKKEQKSLEGLIEAKSFIIQQSTPDDQLDRAIRLDCRRDQYCSYSMGHLGDDQSFSIRERLGIKYTSRQRPE